MAGSSGSGDDIEAGRTNWAESTTVIQGGRPSELDVPFNGLSVFEAGAGCDQYGALVVELHREVDLEGRGLRQSLRARPAATAASIDNACLLYTSPSPRDS